MSIERTPCHGFCPVYRATVSAQDSLVFEGERYVASATHNEKTLPPGSFAKLVAIAEAGGFKDLDAAYPNEGATNCPQYATDLPGVVLVYNTPTLDHSVRFDRGCMGFEGREGLDAMIAEIDAVLALEEWIGEPGQASVSEN